MQVAVLSMAVLDLFFANGVTAVPTVELINHCSHDLYFWYVGQAMKGRTETNDRYTVVPPLGGSAIVEMQPNDGASLKIRDRPHYVPAPKGIIAVEFNWNTSQSAIWYDLSGIDCNIRADPSDPYWCPFFSGGAKIWLPGADIKHFSAPECTTGTDCEASGTYMKHGFWLDEPTFRVDDTYNTIFEACIYKDSPRTAPIAGDVLSPMDEDYTEEPSDGNDQTPPSDPYQSPPAPPAPTAEPQPNPPPSHTDGWHTYPYPMPAHTLSLTRPPARPESTHPAHCYTARPEAKRYPVPAGYPPKILCWNAECTCRTATKEDAASLPPNDPDSCPDDVFFPECRELMRS
jgi:hypothetical protein